VLKIPDRFDLHKLEIDGREAVGGDRGWPDQRSRCAIRGVYRFRQPSGDVAILAILGSYEGQRLSCLRQRWIWGEAQRPDENLFSIVGIKVSESVSPRLLLLPDGSVASPGGT